MAAAAVHVPGELVEDILSRVPVKSLLRFKTASKKWYSLLSHNHQFANFHLKIYKDNHSNSTFIFQTRLAHTLFESLNIDTNASRKFNFPVEIDSKCQLIGSANGLVCVARSHGDICYKWNPFTGDYDKIYVPLSFNRWYIYIWNPCTGECKRIYVPLPNATYRVFGFGYDSCSDDYKIVANWGGHFRVFSLKTNSWKIIFQYTFYSNNLGFHFNGALHWCVDRELVSFDLAKEVFNFTQLPDYCCEILPTPLWEHQGLLYLLGWRSKSFWMMKESGHGEPNWVKLNTFLARGVITPFGISTLGEVVYRVMGDGSGFVKSDIHGSVSDDDKKSRIVFPFAFVYTESIISPRCFDGDIGRQPQSKKMIKRPRKQSLQPQSKKMIKRPRKQRKTSAT